MLKLKLYLFLLHCASVPQVSLPAAHEGSQNQAEAQRGSNFLCCRPKTVEQIAAAH